MLKGKERLVCVDDGIDEVVVRYQDLADFIVDINLKSGVKDLKVYPYPVTTMEPILTTNGMYLNKCSLSNQEEFKNKLVQTQLKLKIKDYKIIDENLLEIAVNELAKEKKNRNRDAR